MQKLAHRGLSKYTPAHMHKYSNDTNDIEMPAPVSLFAHTNYLISASATDFSEKH